MSLSLWDRALARWCMALCVILAPDDTRLRTLLRTVPDELPMVPAWNSAASDWNALAREVENDYLSRALARVAEHGDPTRGHELGYPTARLLVDADRSAGRKLDYVLATGVFESCVLRAVLTWLCTMHHGREVDARLRRAARKAAARNEFRGRYAWTGHGEPAPKPYSAPADT